MATATADLQKQRKAVVNTVAPGDILTMNKNDIAPLGPGGVAAAILSRRSAICS